MAELLKRNCDANPDLSGSLVQNDGLRPQRKLCKPGQYILLSQARSVELDMELFRASTESVHISVHLLPLEITHAGLGWGPLHGAALFSRGNLGDWRVAILGLVTSELDCTVPYVCICVQQSVIL